MVGVCVFAIIPTVSFSKDRNEYAVADSMIFKLYGLEDGTEKVDLLLKITEEITETDCESAKKYARLSRDLAQKINYEIGEMHASNQLGLLLMSCDINYIEAQVAYDEGFRMAVKNNNQEMQIEFMYNLAYLSSHLLEFDKAIDYYLKLEKFALKLRDDELYYDVQAYLGEISLEQGDSAEAFKRYERVIQRINSSSISQASPEDLIYASTYYTLKNEHAKALNFAQAAFVKFNDSENYSAVAFTCVVLAEIELQLHNPTKAIAYGLEGVALAENKNLNKERLDSYKILAEAYRQKNQYKQAFYYLQKEFLLKDSINNNEKSARLLQRRNEVDNEISHVEKDRTASIIKANELESENNRIVIQSGFFLLVLTLGFLFLLFMRLKRGNRLNRKLVTQRAELQKLSIVAANIEQMVMIVGANDRIEWVNKAFERKFGYLASEVIQRTPIDILGGPRTNLNDVSEINKTIFEQKISSESTLIQYSKQGNPYSTRLHITPILNKDAELIRYVVISHDITEEEKVAEQLRELSLVASNTNNSIVIFSNKLEVIWVNDGFSQLTGLSSEQVVGKGVDDIYLNSAMSKAEKFQLKALYESNEQFTVEHESVNHLTNQAFWISLNVTPILDNEGNLIKYFSVAADITEIKKLEEQYVSLVEGSTDIIYEINTKGYFIFVNDVMANTLEYSKKELLGLHFIDLINEADKHRVFEFYQNQLQTNTVTSYVEFAAHKKSGEKFWVGQRARLIYQEGKSKPKGFSVVTRDITEQKKVQVTLQKTYQNTKLLSEIGMQITTIHSIPEIIYKVYGNINEIMDANVFGIAIPNKSRTKLVFPSIMEKGHILENVDFSLDDEDRLAVMCFNTSQEIIISDFLSEYRHYLKNEDYAAPVAGEMAHSIIYLPLIIRGETIGVLTVQSLEKQAYDQFQVSLVKSLASFVAIALDNAALYETMEFKINERTHEVRKQKEELEVNYINTRLLSEIGQLISSSLDIDKIFDILYQKVMKLMDAEIFGIRIYDELSEEIHFKYTMERGMRCSPFTISMDETNNYNVWCIRNKKEVFLNDNKNEHHKYVQEIQVLQGEMPNSLIFYPMIVENKMIGVITIQSFKYSAYQPYHLDILKTLASYIGTAIDNAHLYNTLENRVKERTVQLEQKNTDITSSINYAKRLQNGILPSKNFMRQLLPNSFVYFKPKDIVSGDFYWIERTHSKIFFAVVDCTGHGVPGAMMSIIGRNLLDQAVNEKGITMPSQILNFLQVGLSSAFGQTGEHKANLFDGMDLALCSYDLQTNILDFAGANNSLYLILDGEMIVLRGDKVGISAEYEISNSYTNIQIEVKKGDVVYLTSDGFPDQFGGPKYKKYTYGKMQSFLTSIHQEPMDNQYALLKQEIQNWQGDKDQTDDICLMGIRI